MENRKIVICSSVSFGKEIADWRDKLISMGFDVIKYPLGIKGDITTGYMGEFSDHYTSISRTDAIIVLNIDKRGIPGYIGPGVFAEIAFALGLNRAIGKDIEVYHINPVPEGLPYAEELKLWQELGWIRKWEQE